jgi:hypothetical protein
VPDFQFTSLNVDGRWARANHHVMGPFMRVFVREHEWFFANRAGATAIAMAETGITRGYAERAWDDYTKDNIFPRDGDANDAAVEALIDISSLIRAVPNRVKSSPADYINRGYLHRAQREIASVGARKFL